MELFEQIRKTRDRQELSVRALARKFNVHRRTVRQALASSVPPPRKTPPRVSPVLEPWKATIDGWLVADARRPQEATPHVPAHLAAPGRRARRRRGRVDRAPLRGRGPPAPAHGAAGGDGAPAPSARPGGRGRLRQRQLLSRRPAHRGLDVRYAAVGLGPGVPPHLPEPGPAGLPRRPRARLRALRRGAHRSASATTI